MFERFTERARQVIVLAQEEARMLHHNYIGTEHLLLGLLREADGVAARVLGTLEVNLEEVRGEVARIVGEGEHESQGQIPFTPRAKKVLDWRCAKRCHSATTTSARSTSCSALCGRARGWPPVSQRFGSRRRRARQEVMRVLSAPAAGPLGAPAPACPSRQRVARSARAPRCSTSSAVT